MKLNIISKFVIAVGVPMLAIYGLISYAQFQGMTDMANKDGSLRSRLAVEMAADQLDGRLTTIGSVARTLAIYAGFDEPAAKTNQANMLRYLLDTDRMVHAASIQWGNPNSNAAAGSGWRVNYEQGKIVSKPLDQEERERIQAIYRKADGRFLGWTEPWRTPIDSIPLSAYFHPIIKDRETVGFVAIAVKLDDLQREAAQSRLDAEHLAIVNNDWTLISTSETQDIGKPLSEIVDSDNLINLAQLKSAITSELEEGRAADSSRVQNYYRGENYWISWAVLKETQWILLESVSEASIIEPVYTLLQQNIFIAVTGLIITMITIVLMGHLLTRRIRRLDVAVGQVGSGDYSVRVDVGGGASELTRLASGFNEMVAAFAENLDQLASAEADRIAIDRELEIARQIQQSLQPHQKLRFEEETDVEIAAANLPARHVAGDFYDYWAMGSSKIAFVLGDVSGKGMPAALFMGVARTTIRMVATNEQDPAEILQQVNDRLRDDNEQGLFVTLFLGVYDLESGLLEYANAGHHPGILQPAGQNAREEAEATGTILGTLPDISWRSSSLQLNPGDLFLLYTDGLAEAHGDDGAMIEAQGILDVLDRRQGASAQSICDELAELASSTQNGQLLDDVTILALHREQLSSSGHSDGSS